MNGRSLGIGIAVIAVVAGTVIFGDAIRSPLTATQLKGVVPSFEPVIARETVFPEPRDFDEEGTIVSLLVGGQGLAVRLGSNRGFVQAYAPEGELASVSEGFVHIRGSWTGIDCSYANTLFEGQCTPTVLIESLEQATPQLQ